MAAPLPIGARRLTTTGRGIGSCIIAPVVRRDLPDYGPPGSHLTGPWAKTKSYRPAFPGVLGPIEPGGEGDPCGDRRGNFISRSVIGLAALTTNVQALRVSRGPVIIRQLEYWSDQAVPLILLTATVKVAEDNDETGGLNTSGTRVREVAGSFDVNPMTQKQTYYPNFLVSFPGVWFFKVIIDNQSAVVINAVVWASYDYLT